MRKYGIADENKIGVEHLVREWTRSGLLDKSQLEQMLPDLNVGLRGANSFLRAILFGFTLIIIGAAVFLVVETFRIRQDQAMAGLCIVSALLSFFLAEFLAGEHRLYRFGVEEGAAVAAVILAGLAPLFAMSGLSWRYRELPEFLGLIIASAAALAVYLRFGYRCAIAAAMLCLSLAPFKTTASDETQRLVSAGILACIFVLARLKRERLSEELAIEEYGFVQASAWLGVYVYLNVLLPWGHVSFDRYSTLFHVFSYTMIWIL